MNKSNRLYETVQLQLIGFQTIYRYAVLLKSEEMKRRKLAIDHSYNSSVSDLISRKSLSNSYALSILIRLLIL